MNDLEKIKLIADEVLFTDSGELEKNTSLTNLDSWDSMAALSLIAVLEENFQRNDIGGNEINSLKTIQDIMDLMEKNKYE